MEFISGPVISGFCSAAATTVIASQTKAVLGQNFSGSSFAVALPGIFTHWADVRLWDTVLGCSSILILLALKVISRF